LRHDLWRNGHTCYGQNDAADPLPDRTHSWISL
jgi:hypothetical protein